MYRLQLPLIMVLSVAESAIADVQEFDDKDTWIEVVNSFDTAAFTGFPGGTIITNQYESLGVLFTDGDDNVGFSGSGFPNDGWGLDGNPSISLMFTKPQTSIAIDFPGGLKIELYSSGQLIYTSSNLGGGGAGHFAGLVSSEQFDGALLYDWIDGAVFLDDLHFGSLVPNPGDLDADGIVDVRDLVGLIFAWGPCPPDGDCHADLNFDGSVNVGDLLILVLNWTQ